MVKFCAIISFISVFISVSGTNPQTTFNADGRYKMEIGENVSFTFYGNSGLAGVLSASHASSVFKTNGPFKRCVMGGNEMNVCVNWGAHVVNISIVTENCLQVESTQPGNNGELSVCFPYEDYQWFGGPSRFHQVWPVQLTEIQDTPYLTGYDNGQFIAEPFWFHSKGASIYVFPQISLFWESNAGNLCLKARDAAPYSSKNVTQLRYEICTAKNAVQVQKLAVGRYFSKPTVRTNVTDFQDVIYGTSLQNNQNLDQGALSKLVKEIQDQNYPVSQIEINNKWELCYGTLKFDDSRFPAIRNFTKMIHDLGGKVSVLVHPFVNEFCQPAYNDGLTNNRFVRSDSDSKIQWNGEYYGIVDFTNSEVAQWWVNRLTSLQTDAGVDAFKFEFGQSIYLPQSPKLPGNENPDVFLKKYGEVAGLVPGVNHVSFGRNTQNLSVFVNMMNKTSEWGLDNGLQSVLTTLFQMNLAGYPFVVTDFVGGNGKPTKELFIRWLQAVAFMPVIQFSHLPWDFDTETVEISRGLIGLHNSYSYLFQSAAEKAVSDGTPINTPIWWIAPDDLTALQCRDEYLLAENILVAPILEEGAIKRDIYLPQGNWYNTKIGSVQGPTWLRDFQAPLDTLPYFVKDSLRH